MPQVGEVIEDFLLIDELGKGAFATVFLARQRSMQRNVALKISHDRGHEPATLAQMDHRHIVRVYDHRTLTERGLRLLYMEHVAGGTLEDVLTHARTEGTPRERGTLLLDAIDATLAKKGRRPPHDSLGRQRIAQLTWPQTVALVGAQLADALWHAQSRGILHRDIKPPNILLSANGDPKLADFNISTGATIEGDNPAAYLGGSLAYMAPEQLEAVSPFHDREADELDGRTDLYALCVLLTELLTTELPLPELEPAAVGGWEAFFEQMLAARAQPAATLLAALPSDTPPSLRQALAAGMTLNRDERPPDGTALAETLRLALHPEVESLLARPGPAARRAALRAPAWSVFAATAIPSVVLSALNVLYNLRSVIRHDPTWQSFETQVAAINAVAYGVGVAVLLLLARPFARAVRTAEEGQAPSVAGSATGWSLPGWAAGITLPLWIAGGLAFPIWRTLEAGHVQPSAWLHFGVSNALFGVLAASLAFFLVATVVVSHQMPRVLRASGERAPHRTAMSRLTRHATGFYALCVGVPFASIIVQRFMPSDTQDTYLVLGFVGIVVFGVATYLDRRLRRTLSALRRAFLGDG